MAKLELQDLEKVYSGQVVGATDISLDIEEGEFITLVGPSGSGKSTTLRMIAGLETPTGGKITFDGRDVTDVPPQQRDIAMVFQDYALYPNMTVRENMAFGLKMQNVPKEERRRSVKKTAETLQISDLLDRKIQQLSGGQQQRVALGRSIIREPEVFLLDEPLANLDAKLRVEMRANLVELQRQLDVTTVYVTHNQREAMTMSDRVVVMNEGTIQQISKPQELFNRPRNQFVADFIGTPSMNFIDCSVEPAGDDLHVRADSFEIIVGEDHDFQDVTAGEYVLGIRPQDVSLHERVEDAPRNAVPMTVSVVETGGDELIVHLNMGDTDGTGGEFANDRDRVTVVVGTDVDLVGGQTVAVEFDVDAIHLFERDSGRSVLVDSDGPRIEAVTN